MKKLLFLIFVPAIIFSQVFTHHEDTKSLFETCVGGRELDMPFGADSIVKYYSGTDYNGRKYDYYLIHSDTLADTLISKRIDNKRRYGNIVMTFGLLNDSAFTGAYDTISVTFDMGIYRGHGYSGTGTFNNSGVEWKNLLVAASADTSFKICLQDSTWFYKEPTTSFWVRIRELYIQKNKYFWNIFQFGEE